MSQSKHQLGDLQLAIMRVLWERSEATVRQVQKALRNVIPSRCIRARCGMCARIGPQPGTVSARC